MTTRLKRSLMLSTALALLLATALWGGVVFAAYKWEGFPQGIVAFLLVLLTAALGPASAYVGWQIGDNERS